MSPSSSSSDGDFSADTIDTIGRRRRVRTLTTTASDGRPLYDDVERLKAAFGRQRESLDSIPIEPSAHAPRQPSSERVVSEGASSTETESQGSPGAVRSDDVTHLPPYQSASGPEDVLDCLDDLFCVIDRAGRFQRWNESVRSVTGYSDGEIDAMGLLGLIAEEDRQRVADGVSEAFETGNSRVEASIRTKSGGNVLMEFVSSAVETHSDETMVAGVGREVSEREQHQRRLEQRNQRLEASNERLEQFAYAASHDLQEPLRMVSSYLGLLEERYGDALDEDGREFLDFALDGADRMSEMIDGLLACSRIESEAESFEPVELDGVVADVREDLQLLSDEHQATITVDPLPRVTGDRGQLCQLFQNLLDNAMTHGGDAPPRIHISAERDGARWLLSVRDEGVGIDSPDADRIFEAFHALDGPNESGSGIGLALCKRIAERHGGDICVDSSPAEGTTFSFTLPTVGDDRD